MSRFVIFSVSRHFSLKNTKIKQASGFTCIKLKLIKNSERIEKRLKKTLAPKSISIPHSVMNSFGNEVTVPENIINEFRSEFQHRLRITEPQDHAEGCELLHNSLCDLRLQSCAATDCPDFTITELKSVLGELKGSKCADSSGFIREIFSGGGMTLFQSMLDMFNRIKKNKTFPLDWNKMYVQTIKKKYGSMKKIE